MIKIIQNISKFTLLIAFCFSLIGCGSKNQANPQDEEAFDNHNEIQEKEVFNIDPSEVKEKIDPVIVDPLIPPVVGEKEIEPVKKDDEIIFEEASDIVYATVNVNIRSTYSTKEDNIKSVLKISNSIDRIGINDEWSKVLYQDEVCYIKTDYLALQKPVVEEILIPKKTVVKEIVTNTLNPPQEETTGITPSDESFVAKLNIDSKINQLVCVIGNGGSDSTVSFHIKNENGTWQQQFSIDGDCGSKGITYNKGEGDKMTPAGLFSFTLAFGIKSNPGAKLSYRKITEDDYWVDDLDSPYYNTWVNSKEIPGDYKSEHLIDHSPSYNYALNINYNSECTPGLGSAIFLHCYNGTGKTTGCIAIAEKYMKILIQEIDSSAKILIVPSNSDLLKY